MSTKWEQMRHEWEAATLRELLATRKPAQVAAYLGINRQTIYSLMKRHGILPPSKERSVKAHDAPTTAQSLLACMRKPPKSVSV